MQVDTILDDWPEKGKRKRKIVLSEDINSFINEQVLIDAIKSKISKKDF
ncbi:MAG: hypothetical protein JXR36_03355 [Bacteroidales bacterium]|nr:hypothetical protein [Bacteroidales bacterium]